MHEIFFAVFIYFSYLFYLGRPSLLGVQTKTRRKSNSSTLLSLSGDVHEFRGERFCACHLQALKKCLAQKVPRFGSLRPIPIIQPLFNSSCVALQYEPGTTFFHRAVPELHACKQCAKLHFNVIV